MRAEEKRESVYDFSIHGDLAAFNEWADAFEAKRDAGKRYEEAEKKYEQYKKERRLWAWACGRGKAHWFL